MSSKVIYLSVLTLFLATCKVDPKIKPKLPVDGLTEVIPDGWPQPVYTFSANTISEAKFDLGRSLFYETLLSRDNTISCGSCHQQFVAFAHADHDVSHGIDGHLGTRNAPAIFNLTWHSNFMHDGGVNNLEVQPLAPIMNPIEMDENINNVISKLSGLKKYREMFKQAYGEETIDSQKMFRAMALFMGMMYSYNSKYDQVKRNESGALFTDQEAKGYSLFKSKCATCHTEPLFSDFKFRNNGLAPIAYKDSGRYRITTLATDIYKFKTPSLRNIELTGPYMHDGRFTTLTQCLDHYSGPISNTLNLDPQLNGGISLSTQDKSDIISFLKTLTDKKFISDRRFADPN